MSNMSYCQFQNTLLDLRQCRDTLEAILEGDDCVQGQEEQHAMRKLIQLCQEIAELDVEDVEYSNSSVLAERAESREKRRAVRD